MRSSSLGLALGTALTALTALTGLAASSAFAAPLSPKVSAGLVQRFEKTRTSQDVLVFLTRQADLKSASKLASKEAKGRFVLSQLTAAAKQSQGPLLGFLRTRKALAQPYYIANVIAVDAADEGLVAELAARQDVSRIIANPTVRVLEPATAAQLTDEKARAGVEGGVHRTGADRVWSELGAKGRGMVVGGQDTGIDWDHPALIRQYRGSALTGVNHDYNWHDSIRAPLTEATNPCGYATREPCDDHGHGTHTIGTAVGDDGQGNQIGMAPEAQWIGCRNMDAGLGKPSTYLECFQFFLAPWPYGGDPATTADPSKAPHVMNNSWGCPSNEGCDGTEFLEALTALKAAGVMVVAAAGNEGSSCSTIADAPAHHTDVAFVVGAFDHRSDTIASFSSRGPSKFDGKTSPDVSAPGVSVRSSIPGGTFSGSMWSGTSMASPHVAGAVALLWSAKPELVGQVDATAELFRTAAIAKTTTQSCGGVDGGAVPNNTYGSGLLDVFAAATK
jgi:serine protease AprX